MPSSIAAHSRSRIVNIVCDMTNRQKMKGANVSGSVSAVAAAAPRVSSGDIESIMAKWKFRCLNSDGAPSVVVMFARDGIEDNV